MQAETGDYFGEFGEPSANDFDDFATGNDSWDEPTGER